MSGRCGGLVKIFPPVDLESVLALATEFRQRHPDTVCLLLYSCAQPDSADGLCRIWGRGRWRQVCDGLIVVDMPFEESQLRQPLANLPLEFVQLVAPTTSADRMATTLANRPRPGLRDCGGGGNGRKNCGD
jgi:tryptophan synthase alpha subunit